jgi:hypothetical protein
MIVVDWNVAFVAGFDSLGPVGLRKVFGIKGAANGARDRGEEAVVDAMVLVGDKASIKVKHATHGGQVLCGDPDIKSASSTRLPLGNFFPS